MAIVPVKNKVTRLGLEPRMTEPKTVVLPITPPGSVEMYYYSFSSCLTTAKDNCSS